MFENVSVIALEISIRRHYIFMNDLFQLYSYLHKDLIILLYEFRLMLNHYSMYQLSFLKLIITRFIF
jgi:hypothetical protein